MSGEKIKILSNKQIDYRLDRMVYQVYEQNFEEQELIVVGIAKRGYILAQMMADKLREITSKKIQLFRITLNKKEPYKENIYFEGDLNKLNGKSVLLVDDVLNTGQTIFHAVDPFQEVGIEKLQVLVLVHRDHLNFPVKPEFVGLSLATTLKEHVSVNLEGKEKSVYLS